MTESAIWHYNPRYIPRACPPKPVISEILPDQIIQTILLWAGPKATASMGFVSRHFFCLASDQKLWQIFCEGLGFPMRASEDYRSDYFKLRNYRTNISQCQFFIEDTPASSYPIASSDDLCCMLTTERVEIYNVWTKEIEFVIVPEPDLSQLFSEASQLAAQGIELIQKWMEEKERGQSSGVEAQFANKKLLIVINNLLGKIPKNFWTLHHLFAQFRKPGVTKKLEVLQALETECLSLAALYKQPFAITTFAANATHCVLGFETRVVEIWDRKSKTQLATLLRTDDEISVGVLDDCVCIHQKKSRKLVFCFLSSLTLRTQYNVDAIQIMYGSELLVLYGTLLKHININTKREQSLADFHTEVSHLSYDPMSNFLAVAKMVNDQNEILIFQLKLTEKGYTMHLCFSLCTTNLQSIEWREGALYVATLKSLKRVNIDQNIHTVWSAPKDLVEHPRFVWEGAKLHVRTLSSTSSYKQESFNFFATFSQIAQDLIMKYRSTSDLAETDRRFSYMNPNHKEGIFSYLPQLNPQLEATALGWKKSDSETKACAIELYLKNWKPLENQDNEKA